MDFDSFDMIGADEDYGMNECQPPEEEDSQQEGDDIDQAPPPVPQYIADDSVPEPPEVETTQTTLPAAARWLLDNTTFVDWCDRSHRAKLLLKKKHTKLQHFEEVILEGPPLRLNINRYCKDQLRDGGVQVKYFYPKKGGHARRYVRRWSMQCAPRMLRGILTADTHLDIDFANAHFNLLAQTITLCLTSNVQS
jgi:hypothetical protein